MRENFTICHKLIQICVKQPNDVYLGSMFANTRGKFDQRLGFTINLLYFRITLTCSSNHMKINTMNSSTSFSVRPLYRTLIINQYLIQFSQTFASICLFSVAFLSMSYNKFQGTNEREKNLLHCDFHVNSKNNGSRNSGSSKETNCKTVSSTSLFILFVLHSYCSLFNENPVM